MAADEYYRHHFVGPVMNIYFAPSSPASAPSVVMTTTPGTWSSWYSVTRPSYRNGRFTSRDFFRIKARLYHTNWTELKSLSSRHTLPERRPVRNQTTDLYLEPDLQNILRQSYDCLAIMPKLRLTYDGRLIYETSYEGRKAFLRYDSLAKL